MKTNLRYFFYFLFFVFNFQKLFAQEEYPVKIKDLVEVRGVRPNALNGLGLVVGLQGTGDSKASIATNKAAAQLISRLGVTVTPADIITKNIAVVAVTSMLPPFARIGDRIDVRISSIGDAASLEGGTLLLTTLSGADDQIYATVQGSISQGTAMSGADGAVAAAQNSKVPKTVALANLGIVEKEFHSRFVHNNTIELSLRNADFTTASRIAKAVNENFGEFIADPVNSALIKVQLPTTVDRNNPSFNPVTFLSTLEQIRVTPDVQATIVINERTGTIISGINVVILPVAISHGFLQIQVGSKKSKVSAFEKSTNIGELVKSLNEIGAGPKDIVSIIQALEASKALKATVKYL